MSMSDYAGKIDVLLAKMFALKPLVLPANRNAMERYLWVVWTCVTMLTNAFRRVDIDETLLSKFDDYTKSEESRLLKNLETVKYDIDARDTLELIRGPGRIEKVYYFYFVDDDLRFNYFFSTCSPYSTSC